MSGRSSEIDAALGAEAPLAVEYWGVTRRWQLRGEEHSPRA